MSNKFVAWEETTAQAIARTDAYIEKIRADIERARYEPNSMGYIRSLERDLSAEVRVRGILNRVSQTGEQAGI